MKRIGWIVLALCALLTAPALAAGPCVPPLKCGNAGFELDGIVDPTHGGTGVASLTDRAVIIGRGAADVEFAVPSTAGLPLVSTGASSNPAFQALNLAGAGVTGTLGAGNGGTGQATPTDNNALIGNGTIWVKEPVPTCANGLTYDPGAADGSRLGCASTSAGTSLRGASTLLDLEPNSTIYMIPGGVDAAAARAQSRTPVDMEIDNLTCVHSVNAGSSQTITATVASGTCTTTLTDSTDQVVTISGASRLSNQATTAQAVTAGNCYTIKVASSATAGEGILSCSWTETVTP